MCRRGLRTETSIVVETAQCFSTHHAAMLIGYGAHAICPYLLLESARAWRTSTRQVSPSLPVGLSLDRLSGVPVGLLFGHLSELPGGPFLFRPPCRGSCLCTFFASLSVFELATIFAFVTDSCLEAFSACLLGCCLAFCLASLSGCSLLHLLNFPTA
jgi:Glutamate synthase central domain